MLHIVESSLRARLCLWSALLAAHVEESATCRTAPAQAERCLFAIIEDSSLMTPLNLEVLFFLIFAFQIFEAAACVVGNSLFFIN